jgi:glucitol operon activator protein
MDYVRGALLALAVFWALQLVGSWFQMRRCGDAIRDAARRSQSGYLGVGACKVTLGRGALAIVVLTDDLRVHEFLSMSGLTVLSRFRRHDGFAGLSIEAFIAQLAASRLRRSVALAAADALERARRAAVERTDHAAQIAPAVVLPA